MIRFKKILTPTDFSDFAKDSMNYAFELASLHDATLEIVHVFEEPTFPSFYGAGALLLYGKVPDIRKQAKEALGELAAPLREKNLIDVHTHLLEGHAADRICSYARDNEIDLIVIPTFGLTGLKHVLLGSVAERVVREAPCPVFVFKKSSTDLETSHNTVESAKATHHDEKADKNSPSNRPVAKRGNRFSNSHSIRKTI